MRALAPALVALVGCGEVIHPASDGGGPLDGPDTGIADGAVSDAGEPPGILTLDGDISPVHDPMIIASPTHYYLFATGDGVAVHESIDLLEWSALPRVFAAKPGWITTTSPGNPDHLWAPHVAEFGGKVHLYYSASSFGSNDSCIGHATADQLDGAEWVDDGSPVICSSSTDDYNAIDPAVAIDESGGVWLAFGSFWGGIKMIPLALDGTRQGLDLHALATRSNTAVEAPFIVAERGYYYLFESVDFCCQGVDSTYRILVGRSPAITGPYVDRAGTPLLAGGGTLVLEGDERWRGPGHNAMVRGASRLLNAYHAYDADNGGAPTLRIAEISWTADDWPTSAGP